MMKEQTQKMYRKWKERKGNTLSKTRRVACNGIELNVMNKVLKYGGMSGIRRNKAE